MLVKHRIDNVDERLVAVKEPMPSGEQVAFEPALALVLAEHLHHAPGRREKLIVRHCGGIPLALGHFKEGFKTVRERLVRAKDPKIPLLTVQLHYIAEKTPQYVRVADSGGPRRWHLRRVIAKIRHPQFAQQHAAVGVGIRSHAPLALRRKLSQFRLQAPLRIEELLGAIAP